MNPTAVPLVALLVALAALHAYWGLGGRWPGHDDRSLVELVVGRTRSMQPPGPAACFAVAALLLTAGLLVVAHARQALTGTVALPVTIGFWAAASVMLLRGLAGFVPWVFRYTEGTPFMRLNRTLYSPLCLVIAAGFAAVG